MDYRKNQYEEDFYLSADSDYAWPLATTHGNGCDLNFNGSGHASSDTDRFYCRLNSTLPRFVCPLKRSVAAS